MLVVHSQNNKERIQKFKQTGDSWYGYQNELDKACFKHDMGYGNFRNLTRRAASDEVLREKAFNSNIKLKIWWISIWTYFNGI